MRQMIYPHKLYIISWMSWLDGGYKSHRAVATKDRKGLSQMDIVAVLTKVVQEQQKMISTLREELNELKGRAE